MTAGVAIVTTSAIVCLVSLLVGSWLRRQPERLSIPRQSRADLRSARGQMQQDLSELTRTQRTEVRLAVRRGEAVVDPRLGAAATSLARWKVATERESLTATPWWLLGLTVIMYVIAPRLVLGEGDAVHGALVLVYAGLVTATFLSPLGTLRKLERAERLNAALCEFESPTAFTGRTGGRSGR